MPEPIRIELPVVARDARAARAPATRCGSPGPSTPRATPATSGCSQRSPRPASCPSASPGRRSSTPAPRPRSTDYPAGSVGPTTAKRMDAATPALLRAGIVATIGKGSRAEEVRAAFAETGSVYFAAVGGAAALLGAHVTAAEPVAWPELGTEALVRLTLSDFPAFVAIDATGADLYADAPAEWRAETGGAL